MFEASRTNLVAILWFLSVVALFISAAAHVALAFTILGLAIAGTPFKDKHPATGRVFCLSEAASFW